MNSPAVTPYEGLCLAAPLAQELTRRRQSLMEKRDSFLGEIGQHFHPGLLRH